MRPTSEPAAAGSDGADPAPPARHRVAWDWCLRHRRLVLLLPVVLLAFGVRLIAVYDAIPDCGPLPPGAVSRPCFSPSNDTAYLLDQARALADGRGFVDPVAARRGVDAPGAAHPPLPTIAVAAGIAAGFEDANAIRVGGAAIGALGVALIGLLADRLAGRIRPARRATAAVLAATVAAVLPPLWLADVRLQPEVLVIPLTALLLLVATGPAATARWRWAAALGAIGGLLTLTRQDGLVIATAVVLAAALRWRHAGRRALVTCTAAAGAALLLVVAPWVAYNLSRFSEPVLLTTGSGVVAMYGSCDEATTGRSAGTYDFSCAPADLATAASEDELGARSRQLAVDRALASPAQLPVTLLTRAGRLWQLVAPFDTAQRDGTLEGRGDPWPLVGTWGLWLALAAAAVGAVATRRRGAPLAPSVAVLIATTGVAMASFALTRYRAPADVAVVALAGVGSEAAWWRITGWWSSAVRPRLDAMPAWVARATGFAWLAPVYALALVVRLGAVLVWRPACDGTTAGDLLSCYSLGGDPSYYVKQSAFLDAGSGFRTGSYGETAQHPPLFPLLLTGFRKLGLDTFADFRVAMAFVGALCVVLVALAGWRVGGRAVGVIAGIAAALLPNLWLVDSHLMSESLWTGAAALVILAAYRLHHRPTYRSGVVLGLAVGAAWLVRTEAFLLIPLICAPLLWRMRSLRPSRRLAIAGVAAAVTLGMMAPWVISNLRRFTEPVLLTTNVGQTLQLGACDDVFYGPGTGYFSFACAEVPPTAIDESEGDLYLRQKSLQYYGDNAGRVPVVLAARALRMWNVWDPVDTMRRDAFIERRGYAAVAGTLVATLLAAPLALAGLVALRRRRIPISPLLAMVVLATIVAMSAAPAPRYRVAADVALIVAFAVGLHRLAFGGQGDPPVPDHRSVGVEGHAHPAEGDPDDGDDGDVHADAPVAVDA
ncbi:MAG: glycosyltransferase family 39 protein [Acidimicrobiales bacterium]